MDWYFPKHKANTIFIHLKTNKQIERLVTEQNDKKNLFFNYLLSKWRVAWRCWTQIFSPGPCSAQAWRDFNPSADLDL